MHTNIYKFVKRISYRRVLLPAHKAQEVRRREVNVVYVNFLGFKRTFNEYLNFATAKKGLSQLKEVRRQITIQEHDSAWVQEVINRVDAMHDNIPGILRTV